MSMLSTLGFDDLNVNRQVLESTNGTLDEAIPLLLHRREHESGEPVLQSRSAVAGESGIGGNTAVSDGFGGRGDDGIADFTGGSGDTAAQDIDDDFFEEVKKLSLCSLI